MKQKPSGHKDGELAVACFRDSGKTKLQQKALYMGFWQRLNRRTRESVL